MITINNNIVVDNYTLNKAYFENLKFNGKRNPTKFEVETLNDWIEKFCKLTSKLDVINNVYDLKEFYICDNTYFCNLVEFIIYCFDITFEDFFVKRMDMLANQFLKIEKDINKILEKHNYE